MLRLTCVLLCVSMFPTCLWAESGTPLRFETDVRAILRTHCFQCHGEEPEVQGNLDLRLVRFMNRGGDSGAAIVPGKPDESPLYQRLRDGEMPPDESKQISQEELRIIHDWIVAGAVTVREEPESLGLEPQITEEDRSHWSLQPIRRPAVPLPGNSVLVENPIDAFLLTELQKEDLSFSPSATPRKLLRRLSLDLLGLPPSPDAVQRFVDSVASADGVDKIWSATVDRLLETPQYGERWARHWLDVAGYADSEGYTDADSVRPDAWRYRDYVIDAFNIDMPFDQFITEQLAGDELVTSPLNNLSAADAKRLVATGFLRMAPDGTGGVVADKLQARHDTIADTIRIVSSSFLGLTVGCAQCHDHRYDPISQADYYRFRAIFQPAFDPEKWQVPSKRRISLYTDADRKSAAEIEIEAKKVDAERGKQQKEFISATFEQQLKELPEAAHELARAAHATAAGKRTPEQNQLLRKHPNLNVTSSSLYLYDSKAADELKKQTAKATEIRATKPKQEFVRAITEKPGRIPSTHLLFRGNPDQPRQELQPGGLSVVSLNSDLPQIPADASDVATSGRRLALAKRLTHPDYPLTARVIANRVWRQHFGRGLVETPGDFGVQGQAPSHPELLDWLAVEFMESGWSLKHLHRLILNSRAWRQAVTDDEIRQRIDPDNTLFGSGRLRRLDAEIVRDCILDISGKLNTSAQGAAVPVMADGVGRFVIGKENLNAGRPGSLIDMKGEQYRRSVYIQMRRSRPLAVLEAFDLPPMSPNCDKRNTSTASTQSLLMMNSELLLTYSRHFAEQLSERTSDPTEQIDTAWQLIYCRHPKVLERDATVQFLAEQRAIFEQQAAYKSLSGKPAAKSAQLEALAVMCQMLMGSNEFLYVD
ncbi:PSD1 and planctomycete cytochrome C domain-containing protein [bacterium]|nr:PSD1 and planctomycete cytochrome C domain-containing protein [bacterium]